MIGLSAAPLVADVGLAALGTFVALRFVVHVVLAGWDWATRSAAPEPAIWPLVTVLIPAYNESLVIRDAIESALRVDYPDLRVVVVDDGSDDATLAIARAVEDPRLRVIGSGVNQGKAAAMNLGLEAVAEGVVVTVDADTVLDRRAIRPLVARLLEHPRNGAVAGNLRVGNRGWLPALQTVEYVTSLNLGKRAQHHLRAISTVPGAFGAWRREAIAEVGGVPRDTRIEDTDLTVLVSSAGWRVLYEPAAVAWTEVPDTLSGLVGQRTRWMAGYVQVARKHGWRIGTLSRVGWLTVPDMVWRNLFSVALFPFILPAVVRVVQAWSVWALLEFLAGLLVVDGLAVLAAWLMDRARPGPLAVWPVFRLVGPLFFFYVLVRVAWRAGSQVPWARPARRGWQTPPGGV